MPDVRDPVARSLRSGVRLALLGCTLLLGSGCVLMSGAPPQRPQAIGSTFHRHLVRAELGDPESQNVVGFMLYHGEGVPMDRGEARAWFERAAHGGSEKASRNLAAMAAVSTARDSAVRPHAGGDGERLFLKYCGGCHGFNGIAYYEYAPSFALGERMEKSDAELLRSLRDGHGGMPGWDEKLSPQDMTRVLAAVRSLSARYAAGIGASMNGKPDFFYVFGPMEAQLQHPGK